jgi:serine/threonine-protein kinase
LGAEAGTTESNQTTEWQVNMLPRKIGDYDLKAKLGEGHTAIVYRARAANGAPDVAVKVARDGDEQADWIAQLRREAAVLSTVSGPAIPKFYGYFETDGCYYNVLEYIEGRNGDTFLAELATPVGEAVAVEWGIQICEVFARLHNHQPQPYLYFSLGPDNLMVNSQQQIYVMDYGKVFPYSEGSDYPRLGTIGYSAPEMYVGRAEPRSDLYGLGVFLYHATTRRDPREPAQAFLFHVNPARGINPRLSAAFEDVVLKAVEHKASDRYPTAEAMKAALETCR